LTEYNLPGQVAGNLDPNLSIRKLSMREHNRVLAELRYFWISQAPLMKPHHHALFSLLYSDFSFVLYQGAQIVAYVYAAHNSTRGFVHILATRAGHYRKGYASLLLDHLEFVAREKNLQSLWAYCLPENLASRGFFESSGYKMQKEIAISTDEKRILYKKSIKTIK